MKLYGPFSTASLVSTAIKNNEAILSNNGALIINTGKYTGRAANDKFIVYDDVSYQTVDWDHNKIFYQEKFDQLLQNVKVYLQTVEELKVVYQQNLYAGVNQELKFKLITTTAYHTLFGKTMFYQMDGLHRDPIPDGWTIYHTPDFQADPKINGTNSEAFIIVSFKQKIALIGGTHYSGEVKKIIFTILNYLFPEQGILPLHSSANTDFYEDKITLFFGLSGTGKTTLSSNENKTLIGDDETYWDDNGVANMEDGCYAKCINLSENNEPLIWNAVNQFGTIIENVVVNNGNIDFKNYSITENTRAAYKLSNIRNASITRTAGHPQNIIMLTCDTFGVLPPVAKLNAEEVYYWFLTGYTARLAGTENGIMEPIPVFSQCFGAPFLPRHANVYADMLVEKIKKHNVNVYLINTGYYKGKCGVGERIPLQTTREIINDLLDDHEFLGIKWNRKDSIFNLTIPNRIGDIGKNYLNPIDGWSDKEEFKLVALNLKQKIEENYKKFIK